MDATRDLMELAEFEEKWHRERETVASPSKSDQKTVQLLGSTTILRL